MAFGIDVTRLDSTLQFALGDAQYKLLRELLSVRGDFLKVIEGLAVQEPLLWESMPDVGPEARALVEGARAIVKSLDQTIGVVRSDADQTELSAEVTNKAGGLINESADRGFKKR
jgi:hypothetical protein